jgi:EmrB/QacA subfamily drug resistance transporter
MNGMTEIDYRMKWYVMAAVAMGIFLATIDSSIVNLALPTLVRELHTDFPTVQWVILGYLLGLTALMLSVGRLADIRGKKQLYTTGFVVFTIGSVLCGLSPTIYALIGFRVVQSIGAAMILALGSAIVTESFPPEERGRALGISGTAVSLGIVIGPTLGGLLIDAFSWRWIFFVNLPVGIIGTLMAIRYIPAIKPRGGQRFDIWGSLTLVAGLLCLLLALTWGQNIGFTDGRIVLLFMGSLLFLIVFLFIESHINDPIIDLSIFRSEKFSVGLVTGFITFFVIAGIILLMPFYLENVLGYDTRQVGLMLAIVPIAMGVIAPIAGSISDRVGTRPITVVGLLILLLGYVGLSSLSLETTAWQYILLFFPIGLGMGIFQSPNNSAIMGSAPQERLGVVSGMLAITRTMGQTMGIALLGALWASRVSFYEGGMLDAGATEASALSQVGGLNDTLHIVVVLIFLAFMIGLWSLIAERRRSRRAVST